MAGNRKKIWWWVLLTVSAAVGVMIWLNRDQPVAFVESPPAPRKMKLGFLGSWTWPVRAKVRQAKEKFLGSPRLVTVSGTVVEIEASTSALDLTGVDHVQTNESGERVFAVENADAWKSKLVSLAGTNAVYDQALNLIDDREGQFSGQRPFLAGSSSNRHYEYAGWRLSVWSRAQRDAVNLTCFFTHTEKAAVPDLSDAGRNQTFVRTNFSFGACVDARQGQGIVLLSGTNSNGKISVALLAPAIRQPTGK